MTADTVGGVWSYATDLAAGLAERGLDVTLAVLGPPPHAGQMPGPIPGVAVVQTGLPLDWLAENAMALDAAEQALVDIAVKCQADLVHLNSPVFCANQGFDVPVVGVCHSCTATWWAAVRGGGLPADFVWRREQVARGYAACDRLIAPSQAFADATVQHYGIRPAVVRNGRASPPASPLRKEAFVLTSGRLWDEGKNVAALDRAAARMRGVIRAAGPLRGPDGVACALIAMQSLGHLSPLEMSDQLARAAVFASLALYEPFGLGVLEAAQAGCALVLSDIPIFSELWSGAALFVAPDDTADIAALLDELLDNTERAAELGRLARERAAHYSAASMVAGTMAVYDMVAAS